MKFEFNWQGRRRIFKSGPAEEAIRGTRWGRAREGDGGLPPRFFFEFLALLCAF